MQGVNKKNTYKGYHAVIMLIDSLILLAVT